MRKLIRDKMAEFLKPEEIYHCDNQNELMELYSMKLKEEIEEIRNSNYKDINEYADLIQVALGLASLNGYSFDEVIKAMNDKFNVKGGFSNLVLVKLNPNNPSNKIYFEDAIKYSYWQIDYRSCNGNEKWVVARAPLGWNEDDVKNNIQLGGSSDDVTEITLVCETSDVYYSWDLCN